ncbi:MAG: DUF2723 domain-containing protein [Chloroflexi bacterium]|nr:DUF2723 domain-containing protein [Chloroflexota bacterium]
MKFDLKSKKAISPRWIISVLIFGTALWLYTSTAVPGLVVGGGVESESAELQRVANRLGIAHSTGYPIYTLVGYGAARLGEGLNQNPYTWITYSSALASAVALVLFFQLALLVACPQAALGATGLLMASNTIWHISTIPETQALHAISLVGLFWLMLLHLYQPQKFGPLVGMGFLAGLGLANHRTIVLAFPAVGLAMLLAGTWRHLKFKQWLILGVVLILPILSYSYIYLRVNTDPHVVFSTRPSWFPAEMNNQIATDVIRGKLQTGEGLEGNIRFPKDDFTERLDFVRHNLQAELTTVGFWAGMLGLALLGLKNWRIGLVLLAYLIPWLIFLMAWRLDWKAVVYQHALVMPLIVGLMVLASWPIYLVKKWKSPVLFSILALPLIWLAIHTYLQNHPARDLSNDHRGDEYLAQIDYLTDGAVVFGGGWSPETFILLEFLDNHHRTDLLPLDSRNVDDVIQEASNLNRDTYITPFFRSIFGLYVGSTWIQERGVAFSGTYTDIFLQVRPPLDPRLQVEADGATHVQTPIAPDIELYSYTLGSDADGIRLAVYWRATETIDTRYSVFTHLRYYAADGGVRLLSQDDAYAPVENSYPTDLWEADQFVKDTYFIKWPREPLPPDGLKIVIGMTLSATGDRTGEFVIPFTKSDEK